METDAAQVQVQVRAKRAVYRLAAARFMSSLGNSLASIALSLEVYARTDSLIWLSFSFLFTFGIAGLLTPFGGKLADMFDRKWVMILSDLISAGIWLFMATREGTVWLLVLGFVAHAVAQPFRAASSASIPSVAGKENIDWANSLMTVAWTSADLIGLAAGAILGGVIGFAAACVVNAVSFVISALITLTVKARFQEDGDDEERRGSMWAGFGVLWRNPRLRSLFIVWTVLYLTIDVALVGDIPYAEEMGVGSAGYRMLMFAWVAGALVAGWVVSRWMNEGREPLGIVIGTAGIGVGYILLAIGPWFWMGLLGMVIASFTNIFGEVGGYGLIQRSTADELRGRVFAAIASAGLLANAVGFSFAGFLAELVGPRWLYALCGLGSLALVPLLRPVYRKDAASD